MVSRSSPPISLHWTDDFCNVTPLRLIGVKAAWACSKSAILSARG
jgi:hypothetical protein